MQSNMPFDKTEKNFVKYVIGNVAIYLLFTKDLVNKGCYTWTAQSIRELEAFDLIKFIDLRYTAHNLDVKFYVVNLFDTLSVVKPLKNDEETKKQNTNYSVISEHSKINEDTF